MCFLLCVVFFSSSFSTFYSSMYCIPKFDIAISFLYSNFFFIGETVYNDQVTFESNIFGLITSQIEQKNPFWQVLSVDRSIHNKVMLHTNTKWASKTKIKTLLTTFLNIFFSIFNTNSTIIIFCE